MRFEEGIRKIIYWAQLLNQRGFVTARSGNISCRVENKKILITSHDCYLGQLREEEIILMDLAGNILEGDLEPTSEKRLHLSIHNHFNEYKIVLHAHPPFTTAFFHYCDKLAIFSFEAKFYLGNVPVIPQQTPVVTDIEPVIASLENSNIVVLKNHGVISLGKDFKEAFSLIELLEEQAKVNLLIKRIGISDKRIEKKEKEDTEESKKYKLLSKEHIEKLVELVNNDNEAQALGKKYDLTCSLAVKNQDTGEVVCFYYEKGKIVNTDGNENADFLIVGKEEILKKVFNRQIDPFVASTQGKVRTKGDFTKMSRWYPVLVRTFKLWEQAPVE